MPTLDNTACAGLMEALTAISLSATRVIRQVGTGGVRHKADGSPVTTADEAAEAVIRDGLKRLAPALPIISEEHAARQRPENPAATSGSYFLVDPLDGTRDFIAGRDEYTVNIAVVSDGAPMLGIITAPALGVAWRGIVGRGAERIEFAGDSASRATAIHTRPRPKTNELVILVSRSHLDGGTSSYVESFARAKLIQCGSSVKFCRLADGTADLYPRFAPTRDWDVAAGHAILAAAGGKVAAPDGAPLVYGSSNLLIPAFLATADPITA